jgi:hypothetical protein
MPTRVKNDQAGRNDRKVEKVVDHQWPFLCIHSNQHLLLLLYISTAFHLPTQKHVQQVPRVDWIGDEVQIDEVALH